MKYFYIILMALVLWVPGCVDSIKRIGESQSEKWTDADPDMSKPENFKYFEGALIHLYKNILVVKSSDGQKVNFKAGRNTVFIPKEGRRMRDFLGIGDKLKIRYFIKTYSHRKIGDYFIAFEVRRIKTGGE
jgi:hypothetical protein